MIRGQRLKANLIEDNISDVPNEVLNEVFGSFTTPNELPEGVRFEPTFAIDSNGRMRILEISLVKD